MSKNHPQKIRAGSIRQRLQFLAKDSVLYGGAATLGTMLNLFVLPVLTRLFSNTEYGALDVMTVTGAVFLAIIIMGQDSAIARFYHDQEEDDERKQVIAQAIIIEVLLCVVITTIGWFGAEYILGEIFGIPEYRDIFRFLVVSFPFVMTLRFTTNLLRWTFSRYQFVAVSFGSTAAIIGLTLLFVIGFDAGMRGIFVAQIVGSGLFAVLGLYFCREHLVLPRNFRFGRELLRYGFPYMVVALAGCLIPAVDRALITQHLGLETLGSYAIGYRFAFLIMLPIQSFMSAYLPFAFVIYKESNASETYNRVLTIVAAGFSLLAVVMVSVAEPVIEVVASARYLPGYVAVLPILMGLVIQAVAQITGIGIDLSKKTKYHLIIRTIGMAGSVFFMWLLVEPFGIIGIGGGFLLGSIAQSIAYTSFAYHVYPLRFDWKRPGAVMAFAMIAGLMMQLITLDTLYLQIGYRAAIILVLGTMIWYVMFSSDERGKAIEMLRGYLGRSREPSES